MVAAGASGSWRIKTWMHEERYLLTCTFRSGCERTGVALRSCMASLKRATNAVRSGGTSDELLEKFTWQAKGRIYHTPTLLYYTADHPSGQFEFPLK